VNSVRQLTASYLDQLSHHQPSTGVRQMGKGNNSQKNDKKNKKPKKDAKKPQSKEAGKNS
jgi:hypothetical protein